VDIVPTGNGMETVPLAGTDTTTCVMLARTEPSRLRPGRDPPRDHRRAVVLHTTRATARLVADEHFIKLNHTGEQLVFGSDHCPSNLCSQAQAVS
jgi:hypothetical protein